MKNSELKLFVVKYKRYLIPLGIIVGTFLLVFMVILPQFATIVEKMKQIEDQRAEIALLNSSKNTLNSISEEELDSNLDTVAKALPLEKNVELIFSALSDAAAASDTNVQDFSVKVGGVYGLAIKPVGQAIGAPTIEVSAHISGADVRSVAGFASALEKALPLSETIKFDASSGVGSYIINFFFKAVDASQVANDFNIQPMSQAQKNTLKQLQDWQ